MKYGFVVFLWVGLVQFCLGQTAHVRGRVVEMKTKVPIVFATAVLYGETNHGLIPLDTFWTDQTAGYHFDLDTGFQEYRILGNSPEYYANEISISGFVAGDTLVRDIGIELEGLIESPIIIIPDMLIQIGFMMGRSFPGYFLLKPMFHLLLPDELIERF